MTGRLLAPHWVWIGRENQKAGRTICFFGDCMLRLQLENRIEVNLIVTQCRTSRQVDTPIRFGPYDFPTSDPIENVSLPGLLRQNVIIGPEVWCSSFRLNFMCVKRHQMYIRARHSPLIQRERGLSTSEVVIDLERMRAMVLPELFCSASYIQSSCILWNFGPPSYRVCIK